MPKSSMSYHLKMHEDLIFSNDNRLTNQFTSFREENLFKSYINLKSPEMINMKGTRRESNDK